MNNIFQDASEIKDIIRKRGGNFTLVGGCFDLIHIGHVHLLEYASSLEECLVVAVLSDNYVRTYKGQEQPIIRQEHRAKMVASIRYVDFVYVSDVSPSSFETVLLLQPNSVVFSNEPGTEERLRLRLKNISDASPHTKVRFLARHTDTTASTSNIIAKIRGAVR